MCDVPLDTHHEIVNVEMTVVLILLHVNGVDTLALIGPEVIALATGSRGTGGVTAAVRADKSAVAEAGGHNIDTDDSAPVVSVHVVMNVDGTPVIVGKREGTVCPPGRTVWPPGRIVWLPGRTVCPPGSTVGAAETIVWPPGGTV